MENSISVVPFVGLYLLLNTIPGLIAGFVWSNRGGEFTDGFWMGLGLSVVGIFIAALVRPYPAWTAANGAMRPVAV